MTPEQKSDKRLELEKQAIETQNALKFQALTGINTSDATMSDNEVKLMGAVTQVAFGSFGVQGEGEAEDIPDSASGVDPYANPEIDPLGFEGDSVSEEDFDVPGNAPQLGDAFSGGLYTPEDQAISDGKLQSDIAEYGSIFEPSAAESLTELEPEASSLDSQYQDAPESPSESILPSDVDTPGADAQARGGANSGAQRKQDRLEALQRLEELKNQHLTQAQFPQSGYGGGYGGFNQNRQMNGVGGGAEPQATDQFSAATEAYTSEVQATLQEAAEILQWHAQQLKMVRRILLEAGT